MNKIYLLGGVEKATGTNGEDVYSIIASTASVDRQGDSVDQAGWDLKNFNKNPVLLWAHDYSALPIGKVVSARVEKGKLIADFIFATAEANPFAQQVKKLYEEGIVNASSVGFMPLERNGNVITKSELLELSLVPVPANQDALRRAVEKGFDADFIKTIESSMEKGAVADELTAEEMRDAKYDNYCDVQEIMGALWSVYFDPETPVADFYTLLNETITLLQGVASEDETMETEGKVFKAKGVTFDITDIKPETKAGAKLSKNSLDIISKAMEAMGQGCTHLQSLVDSCAKEEEKTVEVPTEAVQDTGSVEKETVTFTVEEWAKDIQTVLRSNDKANETVLGMVNRFLDVRKTGVTTQ